ncbi:MAG: Na+/proline symporter [Patescibacteria group bacterium]|jgi:Na+/proline symporter
MVNQLTPTFILGIIAAYFAVLMAVSWFTGKSATNKDFFIANRQSPWYLVAFGMIGASLSGVTFISVPGWVAGSQFSYMQMVFGYLLGYLVIATVLMPMYYRLQLTSIYTYLEQRFGEQSYKTGAAFFILSRTIGASFRLYLVAIVLQEFVLQYFGIPFWLTVALTILLVWIYTFRGGIKTIVITDTLQTFCMLLAVILTIGAIGSKMELSTAELVQTIKASEYSQVFFFEGGWMDTNNFFKKFLAGASMAIVMTGLDQDMMQKNLSCKSIGDAQKNMFWFSIVLVFANLLFLGLGALLYLYSAQIGLEIPSRMVGGEIKPATDLLYPTIALQHLSPAIGGVFILGLIAAAYSSADSALTALTTSFCVDFLGFEKEENKEMDNRRTRLLVHIGFSVLLFFVILLFWYINDQAVISQIFTVATYTYGPLLGLYAFGFFLKRPIIDRLAPYVCIAAPIITFFLNKYSEQIFFGYKFSFELLILNGLITFLGLFAISFGAEGEESVGH